MKKIFFGGIALLTLIGGLSTTYGYDFSNVGGGETQVITDNQDNTSTPEDGNTYAGETAGGDTCDPKEDIMLNISIPFIGRCIKKDPNANQTSDDPNNSTVGNVFPKLMGGMMRLVMTAIYIIGFLGILVGGFMIAIGKPEDGKALIIKIIGGLILLGASGVILNLINPNFFGTNS